MLPKNRWTLNPRKWFGALNSAPHKPDRRPQIANSPTSRINTPTTSAALRLLSGRNKTKVTPPFVSSIMDRNSANPITSHENLQLSTFAVSNEKLIRPSSTKSKQYHHTNILVPQRTEPSIQKYHGLNEGLSINPTPQWTSDSTNYNRSQLSSTPHSASRKNFFPNSSTFLQKSELNMSMVSNECLVDYPQMTANNFVEKYQSSSIPTRSSSSIDDNDVQDESTSSGIFTDERPDTNDGHRTASKETLSTFEVLSVESINDSDGSVHPTQSRLPTSANLLSASKPPPNNSKYSPVPKQRRKPVLCTHRSCSAEGILKDNQLAIPAAPAKVRQSSALITKKIEKRPSTSRSPTTALEKVGLKRIAFDTYRLTANKDEHSNEREHEHSIVQYAINDDALPPANDEEIYAKLPRASSTEQLNDDVENNARVIVDECIRPIVASMNKSADRSKRNHHRTKRLPTNTEHTQIDIDAMVHKLLTSVNYSTYTQYQRC